MTIHDMFHWKMLIPKHFVIKCVFNRNAYLSGRLLYIFHQPHMVVCSKVEDVNLCTWFQKLQAKQCSSYCYSFGYIQLSNDF
jgi:hypothetical protein